MQVGAGLTRNLDTTFKKTERILKKKEFDVVYKHGKRFFSPNFIVIVSGNREQSRRIGVVVNKKVGRAHRRNRIKRLVREFFRLNKFRFPENADTVVLANRLNSLSGYHEVVEEISEVLKKCAKSSIKYPA